MTRRAWAQLRPFQEHSLVVTIGGLLYISYGCTLWSQSGDPAFRSRLPHVLGDLTGGAFWPWALIWVGVGVCAIASAVWPTWSKVWGYAVMQYLAALWALGYLTSIVFLHAPGTGWAGAEIWGIVILLWFAVARLINPGDLPPVNPPSPRPDPLHDPGG